MILLVNALLNRCS